MMSELNEIVRESRSQVEEMIERAKVMKQMQDALDMLMDEVKRLTGENEKLTVNVESMEKQVEKLMAQNTQLKADRDVMKSTNAELEMKVKELTNMVGRVAEKTEHDELQRALRKYMNQSRRKTVDKRAAIKAQILEIVVCTGLQLSDEMRSDLDTFDDDTSKVETSIKAEKLEMSVAGSQELNFTAPVGQVVAHADAVVSNHNIM